MLKHLVRKRAFQFRRTAVIVACITASLMATPRAIAQAAAPVPDPAAKPATKTSVFDIIPGNAWMVLVVRDINALDQELTGLMREMGIPISPVLWAKGQSRIVEGIDDHGTLAFAMMPRLKEAAGHDPGSMALFVPTTDKTKLLQFLEPEPVAGEADLQKANLLGKRSYIGSKGDFTVFAPEAVIVKSIVKDKSRFSDMLRPEQNARIEQNRISFITRPAAMLNDPPLAEMLRNGPNQAQINAMRGFDVLQLGLRMDSKTVQLSAFGRTTEPTPIQNKIMRKPLFALPNESFVLALSMRNDWFQRSQNALLDGALQNAPGLKAEAKSRLAGDIKKLQSLARETSAVISMLPDDTDGAIGITKVIHTNGKAADMLRGMDQLITTLRGNIATSQEANAALQRVVYRRAAEQADDVSVDHLLIDLSQVEEVDDTALKAAVGKEGLVFRMGMADANNVVVTFGGGVARFQEAVAAVRAKRSPLVRDPSVRDALRTLPENRMMEGVFAPDRLMNLLRQISIKVWGKTAGIPKLARQEHLIRFAAGQLSPSESEFTLMVPRSTIIAIKDAALESAAEMIRPLDSALPRAK